MIASGLAPLAVPLDSLRLMPGNPRRGDVDAVAASLARFGQRKPIVVRASDRTITAGNHTWLAAERLGWSEIAAVVVDDDEAMSSAFALADNRTADLGGYDDALLADLIGSVGSVDAELLAATGWAEDAVADLLARVAAADGSGVALTDPDVVPEVLADPVTKPGDVWLLGPHRVLCGDCRTSTDVARLLAGCQVNVAFTSPPYASQRAYDESSGFQPIRPASYVDWFAAVQSNVKAHLADDGSWFVNVKEHSEDGQRSLYVKDLTLAHVRIWGWRFVDELCWVDPKNGVPGRWPNRFKNAWEPIFHYGTNTKVKFNPIANGTPSDAAFNYSPATRVAGTGSGLLGAKGTGEHVGMAHPSNVVSIASSSEPGHSAAFPVALPAWFIRAYSDAGDVVFDPFLGSGSTLIASHQEQRVCYGMEISPRYVDVTCRRFQEHTGQKPVLESSGEPHDFTA